MVVNDCYPNFTTKTFENWDSPMSDYLFTDKIVPDAKWLIYSI